MRGLATKPRPGPHTDALPRAGRPLRRSFINTGRIMDTTPVTPGVLEGLDRFLALSPRPETHAEILALKASYAARSAHESRVSSAKEELEAAEAGLRSHGAPVEPSAIVAEEILLDLDLRLGHMRTARAKFRGEGDKTS